MKWPDRPSEIIRQVVRLRRDKIVLLGEMFEGAPHKLAAVQWFFEGRLGNMLAVLGMKVPENMGQECTNFEDYDMNEPNIQESMLELAYDLEKHGL